MHKQTIDKLAAQEEEIAALKATNFVLKAKLARVGDTCELAIKEAYASGYAGGHNDTVEGTYWDIGEEEAQEFYDESRCETASSIRDLDSILSAEPKVLVVVEDGFYVVENQLIDGEVLEVDLPTGFGEEIGAIILLAKEED